MKVNGIELGTTIKKDKGVAETLKEFKQGTLKTGSGQTVTSRKQAIAIGLEERKS